MMPMTTNYNLLRNKHVPPIHACMYYKEKQGEKGKKKALNSQGYHHPSFIILTLP